MAAKSLTLKFGADTSRLTKALGKMRRQITATVSGAFGAVTSLRGMALAGIGGFGASQLTSTMMNLSPEFANAMLKLSEPLERLTAVIADRLAPYVVKLADFLEFYLGKTATAVATGGTGTMTTPARGVGFSVRGIMNPGMYRQEAPFGFLFRSLDEIFGRNTQ